MKLIPSGTRVKVTGEPNNSTAYAHVEFEDKTYGGREAYPLNQIKEA